MRYKIKIKCPPSTTTARYVQRWWLVKRSNKLGFLLHCEEGPAIENVTYLNTPYKRYSKEYYLKGNKCRNRYTWINGLEYKRYKGKGML
jgi:hypothetical protein